MREDYLEQLEKMFPDGYVLVYTCKNNTVRLGFYNPEGLDELEHTKELILQSDTWQGGEMR